MGWGKEKGSSVSIQLKNKIAWVTGATGTIGRAVGRALAEAQTETILSSRSEKTLEKLANRVRSKTNASICPMPLDVTNHKMVDAVARRIVERYGRIDFLINCVTIPVFGDFLGLSDEDWEAVIQTKYLGYVRCMRAVIPYMIRQKDGRIVNITGRGGKQPSRFHLPGSSVNAAVNLLTKGLAGIYGKYNIRINAIAPGPIASKRLRQLINVGHALASPGKPKASSGYDAITPLHRLGRPQEVANAILFLLSEQSSYITGTILEVDGGGTKTV